MPKARIASFGFLVEIIKSEKIYFLKHIPRTPSIPTWTSPSHEAGRPGVRPDPTLRFDLGGSLGLVLLSSVYPHLGHWKQSVFLCFFSFRHFSVIQHSMDTYCVPVLGDQMDQIKWRNKTGTQKYQRQMGLG